MNASNNTAPALNLERAVITSTVSLLGTASSIALLIMLRFHKERQEVNLVLRMSRNASKLTLVNLGISTLILCLLVLPFQALLSVCDMKTLSILRRLEFCSVFSFVYFSSTTGAIYTNVIVAINRLTLVAAGARPLLISLRTVTNLTVVVVWIVIGLFYLVPYVSDAASYGFSKDGRRCGFVNPQRLYFNLFKSFLSVIPLTIMVLCYVAIFILSKRRISCSTRLQAYQSRLSKRAFFACVVFMVFFVPNTVYGFVGGNQGTSQNDVGGWIVVWLWLGLAVNPFIYIILDSKFRRAILRRRIRIGGILDATSVGNATTAAAAGPPRD